MRTLGKAETPQAIQIASSEATNVEKYRPQYYPLLDAVRGVAALMVVIFHTHDLFGIVFHQSFLAVDLFFVLSGVVVANSYEVALLTTMSVRRFMLIRIVRLYPLYLLSIIFSVVTLATHHALIGRSTVLATLITTAVLVLPMPRGTEQLIGTRYNAFPLNPPAWSLFFELVGNLAYALILRWLTVRRIAVMMAVCGVTLILLGRNHTLDIGWTWKGLPAGAARFVYSFFGGVLIFRLSGRLKSSWIALTPAWLASSLVLLATFAALSLNPPSRLNTLYELGAILLIFPIIVGCAMQIQTSVRFSPIFRFVGLVSYGMYVLHEPLHRALVGGGETAILRSIQAPFAGVGFMVLLVAGTYILDKVYDAPVRRLLLSIAFRHPGS